MRVNNHKVLTEKSTCSCAMGGLISVIDKGHGEQHAVIGMGSMPPDVGKDSGKSAKSEGNNSDKSVSKPTGAAAAKSGLDEKAVKELKEDAKDTIDRFISLGNLLVRAESARPKASTEKEVQTITQTPIGTTTETKK